MLYLKQCLGAALDESRDFITFIAAILNVLREKSKSICQPTLSYSVFQNNVPTPIAHGVTLCSGRRCLK